MRRRVAGVGLVVAAFIAAAAVGPRLGPGVAGVPTPGTLPSAPLTGACLADDGSRLRTVSCSAPHVAEVTRGWSAWDPTLTATERNALRAGCRGAAQSYLGGSGPAPKSFALIAGGPGWQPLPLTIVSDVVSGPVPDDPIGYGACVIRVQSPSSSYGAATPVTGRISELMPMDRRPSALRTCYVVQDLLAPPIPCRTWHLGEELATQIVSVSGMASVVPAITDPSLVTTCATEAARVVGVDDPTFGGRLRVAVDGRILQTAPTTTRGTLTVEVTMQLRCLIETIDGRLTDSVIALGDRTLPLR
jgi:hypothetical protein